MRETTKGWVIFIAALGMMASLLAQDMKELSSFQEMKTVAFLSDVLFHFGTVAAAFVGGRLIPTRADLRSGVEE